MPGIILNILNFFFKILVEATITMKLFLACWSHSFFLSYLLLIRGNIRGRWDRGGWYWKSWASFVVQAVVLLCQIVITYNICLFYFADTLSIVMIAFMYSLKFDD